MPSPRRSNVVSRFLGKLGPGLITGAADDDPSGIATYSIAGRAARHVAALDGACSPGR